MAKTYNFHNDREEEFFFTNVNDKFVCYILFASTMWSDISLHVTIASRPTTHLEVPYWQKRPVCQVALRATQYP